MAKQNKPRQPQPARSPKAPTHMHSWDRQKLRGKPSVLLSGVQVCIEPAYRVIGPATTRELNKNQAGEESGARCQLYLKEGSVWSQEQGWQESHEVPSEQRGQVGGAACFQNTIQTLSTEVMV